jgi:hypothetical protein
LQIPLTLATDVTENGKYIAAVIGPQADIERFHASVCKVLGVKVIHMVRIDDKPSALKALSSASNSIWFYCLRAEIPSHKQTVMKKKGNRTPKHVLWGHLNYCAGTEIKKAIQPALVHFKQNGRLEVEADPDTERMWASIGEKALQPAAAHQIADMVAYFNHKRNAPKSVRAVDISREVHRRLEKRLKIM